jgi:hypothetical protein
VARLNERICAMRGFSPVNVRLDPLVVQVQEKPSSTDRIRAALDLLAAGRLSPPSGNGTGTDEAEATDPAATE